MNTLVRIKKLSLNRESPIHIGSASTTTVAAAQGMEILYDLEKDSFFVSHSGSVFLVGKSAVIKAEFAEEDVSAVKAWLTERAGKRASGKAA
jgi:hypothetical protein